MGDSDVDLAELSEKAELLAEATGRDKSDVMADLLDDGVLNDSNKQTMGILDKANEQAVKAKALLMTVLPVIAILLGGGGAEMLGLTDFMGNDNDEDDEYYDPAWDIVWGCTALSADNYQEYATEDDGSCYWSPEPVYGCMNQAAMNYDPEATEDDGTCQPRHRGCMDSNAENYDDEANEDDGSCEYPPEPIYGCTDENAQNHQSEATDDDGSCEYPPDPEDCSVGVENHYRGHVGDDAEQDAILVAFKVVPNDCDDFDLDVKIALFQNGHAPNYTHDQQVSGDQIHDFSHVFDDIPVGNWIPKIIVRLDGVEKENVNFWALDIEAPECEGTAMFYDVQTQWILENNDTTAKMEMKWDADWSCEQTQYIEVDILITNESGVVAYSKVAGYNITFNEGAYLTICWDENVNLTQNYTLSLSLWHQNESGAWLNPDNKTVLLGRPQDAI